MSARLCVLLWVMIACSIPSRAGETLTVEPGTDSYHFVSHYRLEINASTDTVWKHLINLGSWMYDFEMSHHTGEPNQVGQVLRLYPGQDFFMQITAMVANESLVMANLPSTFRGEHSTGVGVITLQGIDDKTVVNLTMSRRYTWQGQGENTVKGTRASAEFKAGTAATWNRFLDKLRSLAEGA